MNGYIDVVAVAESAIELFGEEKQCTQAMEELNELAVGINHYKRGKFTSKTSWKS